MDTIATFIPHIKAPKSMKPRQGSFDDPSGPAKATAVRCATFRELRLDASAMQGIAVGLRVIRTIALDQDRFADRAAGDAPQRRNLVYQWQQLGDVVPIGGRYDRSQGNAARLGENVMFRPRLTAIGWVRSSFFPPRSARTEALSTIVRARSSWPRWRNSASRAPCRRRHTPARCQLTSRRQQVLPDPQPISFGSICHGIPLRSTNRMPVNAARSETRGRPMCLNRRRGGFGKSGSIRVHNASSIKRLGMRDRLIVGHATVPIRSGEYKRHVTYF
jgi:hypothetical protein